MSDMDATPTVEPAPLVDAECAHCGVTFQRPEYLYGLLTICGSEDCQRIDALLAKARMLRLRALEQNTEAERLEALADKHRERRRAQLKENAR